MHSFDGVEVDMAGAHRAPLKISERDKSVFIFLWRYRAATMRSLHALFFPDTSFQVCNHRLLQLRKFGYLTSSFLGETKNRSWRLDHRGFYAIREKVGVNKMGTYHSHDTLVDHMAMSLLLGDWYLRLPGTAKILTNQDLWHKSDPDVPQSLYLKPELLPQGLWRFRVGPVEKFVALRIDLFGLSDDLLEHALRNSHGLDTTIWITPSRRAHRICRAIHKLGDEILSPHIFLNVEAVEKKLWQAKFKYPPFKKITLGRFLESYLTIRPKPKPPTSSLTSSPTSTYEVRTNTCATHPLLDFRGSYVNSNIYQNE